MTPSDPAVREAEEHLEGMAGFLRECTEGTGVYGAASDDIAAINVVLTALRAERARAEEQSAAADMIAEEREAWKARASALEKRVGVLEAAMQTARDLLLERTHGNPARSAGHNARLVIEAALAPQPEAPAETLTAAVADHVERMKDEVIPAIERDLKQQAEAAHRLRLGLPPITQGGGDAG